MITEGDEETSGHIEYYMEKLKEKIGDPELIFCLDSGALDFDHMWTTTSLRGFCVGFLKVKVLTDGVHSGDASGVVPSPFRIANMLVSRIENP
jgi:acetylornithine deacetylase/succinyl-diaminopimelate desuccinylase-like protein